MATSRIDDKDIFDGEEAEVTMWKGDFADVNTNPANKPSPM